MNINLLIISITAIVAIIIFAQMRNRQAKRNDERRDRLEQRQEELIELLKGKDSQTE
jgi:hypothetical protein